MAINSLSASSYGLSGLVSGMNTQEMVEKLLTGTQSKIDSASQKKTKLQNQQQMYRDVANKLKALQTSYLSFTSGTNLLSSSFYNTMSATVKPPTGVSAAFSVTASSKAAVGNVTMNYIQQLATARTSKTTADASAKVGGTFSKETAANLLSGYGGLAGATTADADMNIKVGNTTVTITDAVGKLAGKQPSEVVRVLNEAFAANGGVATASYVNNKLVIKAANEEDFIAVTGNTAANAANPGLAVAMFGASSSYGNKGTFSAAINTDSYNPTFEVNLDGRTQTVSMDINALRTLAAGGDATDLAKNISDQLTRAFGTGVKLETVKDGANKVIGFTLDTATKSQKVEVSGSSNVMGTMGLKSGVSNKLNTQMAVKDLNFATALQGNTQTFSINGVEFSYTADTQLSTIISDINSSKAGVKISYVESEDRFVIQSAETGAGTGAFELKQTEGNLLTSLFGVKGGSSLTTHSVSEPLISGKMDDSVLNKIGDGGTFTFNVNGTDYRFTVSRKSGETSYDPTRLAEELNKQFKNTFGTLADGTQAVTFEYTDAYSSDGSRRFVINANDKSLEVKTVKADASTNTNMLAFTAGQSTHVTDGDAKLSAAGISFGTGSSITIKMGGSPDVVISATELAGATTYNQLAALLNEKAGFTAADPKITFDEKSAAFKVMGVEIPMEIVITGGAGSKNTDSIFGTSSIAVSQADQGIWSATGTAGQNAIFKLNGVEMERSTNAFTIDGLTYTLHSTTHKDQSTQSGGYQDPTQVTVTRDTESIVKGLQEFLKLYNETIDYINGLYRADATYKDYPPLTAAQKADMSENEIKAWEEKSKEGLLRNDQYLESILGGLRAAMNTRPEGSTLALYDLGISTSFYTNDGNFTEQGEGLLKAAVEADPEAIYKLFASDGGIMEKLNEAINGATRSSYANPGTLVAVAGSNALDTSSTIYKQIKDVDDQLETLETRYWNEYDRYWKQFNAMEKIISQMNSQSGWLTQMMGG